jgi:hypothetical protein
MCPHCQAPSWADELEVVGEVDAFETPSGAFEGALGFRTPSLEDLFALLKSDLKESDW